MQKLTIIFFVKFHLFCGLLLYSLGLPKTASSGEAPYNVSWIKQIGTNADDYSYGVSFDRLGFTYITGRTHGDLAEVNSGDSDIFLSKYDEMGNLQWSRQFGTTQLDEGHSISTDGIGNIFISGITGGTLHGANFGFRDAFLTKYDAAGNLTWTRQIGTEKYDDSTSVSADGLGNVYVSGTTLGSLAGPIGGITDAFICKYDISGNLAWARQVGTTSNEHSWGVSADGVGNVYLTGFTDGAFGGPFSGARDAFITKFSSDGNLIWKRQIGTADYDDSYSVKADGMGSVFVSGRTRGSLDGGNSGDFDAFLSKFDQDGNLLWSRQLGSSQYDSSNGVTVDVLGNVYISGITEGLVGDHNFGAADVFILKYDPIGNLIWKHQLGTREADDSWGVSADLSGNVYISGYTAGSLDGLNLGRSDAYIAKLSPQIPEPSTFLLLGSIALPILVYLIISKIIVATRRI
ncbi:MAG: SBBP repeat-containing protein [Pirellulales bacterium]|nr:SBBP repeat-containing protein [Pirellulales bacterium]